MKKLLSYLTFPDKILISSIILISLIFIILPISAITQSSNDENQIFVIRSEYETKEIPIEETYTDEPQILYIEGPTGQTIVEVHEGRIRVKEEPEEHIHRIAERQGWIDPDSLMNTIINLPNRIQITIKSPQEDPPLDGITQ